MSSFISKKIENPLSLGEKLKEGRESKEINLSEASKRTNISIKYLEAIEAGRYKDLPGEVYAKNFLKVYAKFLDLNSEEVLALFNTENKIYTKTRKKPENDFTKPVEKISKANLIVAPKILKGALIGLVALVVLSYLGFKVKLIVTPPELLVITPTDDLITSQKFIEVSGQVELETALQINGQQVLTDGEGKFTEIIDLQPGANVIEVKAIKRHGKETKVYRQVVVVDEEENTQREDSN